MHRTQRRDAMRPCRWSLCKWSPCRWSPCKPASMQFRTMGPQNGYESLPVATILRTTASTHIFPPSFHTIHTSDVALARLLCAVKLWGGVCGISYTCEITAVHWFAGAHVCLSAYVPQGHCRTLPSPVTELTNLQTHVQPMTLTRVHLHIGHLSERFVSRMQ